MDHSEPCHLDIGKFSVPISQHLLNSPYSLSPREADVLTALIVGLNVKEAAAHFSVSRHTIDIFKRRIFQKLGVHNSASAAALGMAAIVGAQIKKPSDLPTDSHNLLGRTCGDVDHKDQDDPSSKVTLC